MIRLCETCGKPIVCECMTDGYGDWYTHDGYCFEAHMDRVYGKHRWMELGNGEKDEYGGYYIATANVVGGFEGTGIYYTEYEDDEIFE